LTQPEGKRDNRKGRPSQRDGVARGDASHKNSKQKKRPQDTLDHGRAGMKAAGFVEDADRSSLEGSPPWRGFSLARRRPPWDDASGRGKAQGASRRPSVSDGGGRKNKTQTPEGGQRPFRKQRRKRGRGQTKRERAAFVRRSSTPRRGRTRRIDNRRNGGLWTRARSGSKRVKKTVSSLRRRKRPPKCPINK